MVMSMMSRKRIKVFDEYDNDDDDAVFDRVKEVVCFGEGAGANILTRFAVSIIAGIPF